MTCREHERISQLTPREQLSLNKTLATITFSALIGTALFVESGLGEKVVDLLDDLATPTITSDSAPVPQYSPTPTRPVYAR